MSATLDIVKFREAPVEADKDAVRRIVESTGFFNTEEVEIAVELVDERLAKGTASGYYFIFAEAGGEVIGYTCHGPIGGTKESFDFYWIATHDNHKGTGLGTRLLNLTEKAIYDMGGRRIYVETSSRAQYEPTRAFYEKRGYTVEAILPEFYGPGDGKVIYLKTL